MRHAFFNCACDATASRSISSGGLRPASTRLHGKTANIDDARKAVSSSTRKGTEPVGLPHGALEALGELAVVLTELGVAPGFGGVLRVVFVADLGAVFFPKQHEGDTFGAQFLVDATVVGLSIGGRRCVVTQ